MSWILLAVLAYLLLAIVNLADKFLLDKVITSARVYTFLVNTAGLLILLFAPWYLYWPGWHLFGINIAIGALFPLGLWLMYASLKNGEPSKVLVLIGGSVPVFTLLLSLFVLGERFTAYQWLSLIGLIAGAGLIAYLPAKTTWLTRLIDWLKLDNDREAMGLVEALMAALIFAIVLVASKSLYQTQSFMSAFIWLRIGSAAAVLTMLFSPRLRQELADGFSNLRGKAGGAFLANQGLAAIGFSLQNYAIFLGSVAIVNAMQGVQYAFLLIFGALLSIFKPKLIKEKITTAILVQKILAIALISISLYLLVI